MYNLLSWNIFRFATGLVTDTARCNTVLDVVNPAAGPAYQIFVVIEPQTPKYQDVGEIAVGAGSRALHVLRAKLRARPGGANWELAPPLVLASGTYAETVGIFYDRTALELVGPKTGTRQAPPWNTSPTAPGTLFWTDLTQHAIRRADLDGRNVADVIPGQDADGLAVDTGGRRVYWRDTAVPEIRRADLDGNNNVSVVAAGTPEEFYLDLPSGRIYWRNTAANQLNFAALDGTNPKLARISTGNAPVNITQSAGFVSQRSQRQELFWADPTAGDIKRFAKNSNSRLSLSRSAAQVRVLTGDPGVNELYWIDGASNEIVKTALNAAHRVVLVNVGTPSELALDAAQNTLLYLDTTDHTIRSVPTDNAGLAPSTVLIRPDVPDAVTTDPTGHRYWLYDAGNALPNHLRCTDAAGLHGVELAPSWHQPTRLAVDPANQRAYWRDAATQQIHRADHDGQNRLAVVAGSAGAFALDPPRNKIYWIDRTSPCLCRANLDGTSPEDLVPIDPDVELAVDLVNAQVYWADAHAGTVTRADLNGTNAVPILVGEFVTALVVDPGGAKIYWVDGATRALKRANPDGTVLETLVNVGQPESPQLSADGATLFWLDRAGPQLRQRVLATAVDSDVVGPGRPEKVTPNPAARTMYWIDRSMDYIRCASAVDGSGVAEIVTGEHPAELAVFPGTFAEGQCEYDDATGAAIEFDTNNQRRPFMARFRALAPPGGHVVVVAMHAPKPEPAVTNRHAQDGTAAMGGIVEITTARGADGVVIVGDFNCCTIPAGAAVPCGPQYNGHAADAAAFTPLTAAGYALHVTAEWTSLKSSPTWTQVPPIVAGGNPTYAPIGYGSHCYDHILTQGFTTVQNARCVDLIALGIDDALTATPGLLAGPAPTLTAALRRVFNRTINGSGVSDHLPVRVELDL